MDICHILLNNGQLGKISKEQRSGGWEVWSTDLVNPDFAAYARLCGGEGYRVTEPEQLSEAISAALASKKPALVEILTDPRQT
jgi:pyruvate oxidase